MKSKIRVLTEHTINKIAAGEVIENPSSVVKELVENSLDAGATEICIEIKGGGRQLIRITDNGCGMSPDDALLCLERHATSKMKEVEDLLTIGSMGFRGEAIPSIASISKFTLLTCPNPPSTSDEIGTMVIVEGGKILRCSPAVCNPGTTIEIKTLFFNVPVRKKFQRSPAQDANDIQKVVTVLALGYPEIKFQLINNEKDILLTPLPQAESPLDILGERISNVLGKSFLDELRPIEAQKENCFLRGFVGSPTSHRQNRTGQYLFINKRGVFSPFIAYAVREGYGPSIPANRHPTFILHLMLPGEFVDVNVHPQKKEVRLRQENIFKEMIVQTVEKTLQEVNGLSLTIDVPSMCFPQSQWDFNPQPKNFISPTSNSSSSWLNQEPQIPAQLPIPSPPLWTERKKEENASELTLFSTVKSAPKIPKALATLPRYIIVDMSFCESYKGEGLYLIDQHGAHARIIYEKLLKQKEDQTEPMSSQLLLIPYSFDANPVDYEILLEQLPSLNAMGISIKEFGQATFIVDAIPNCFGNVNMEELVKDILHQLNSFNKSDLQIDKSRKIAIAASRTTVSKNKRLSLDEAQALLNQLFRCQVPNQCPQGKPIVARISPEELGQYFK